MGKFDTVLGFFCNSHMILNLVVAKKGGQIFLGASGADLLLIDLRDRKTVARFPLPPKKRWQAATGRVLTKEDIQVDGDPESPSTVKIEDRPPKSRSIWTIWKLWQTKVDFDDSFPDQQEKARKAFVKSSWMEFVATCKKFVEKQSKDGKCKKCEPGRWL